MGSVRETQPHAFVNVGHVNVAAVLGVDAKMLRGENLREAFMVVYVSVNPYKGRFFFVSRLLRVVYAASSKKQKQKNTMNTRGCSFWVPLNTRGGLTRTQHGKDTH